MAYVIKVEVADPEAAAFRFDRQKTMYGGKRIAPGDEIFVIASENSGGAGLVAMGRVMAVKPTPRLVGVVRQTPRMGIEVRRTALARRRLGRAELKPFAGSQADPAQAELHFKFYRQATDKIAGISETAAAFLRGCF